MYALTPASFNISRTGRLTALFENQLRYKGVTSRRKATDSISAAVDGRQSGGIHCAITKSTPLFHGRQRRQKTDYSPAATHRRPHTHTHCGFGSVLCQRQAACWLRSFQRTLISRDVVAAGLPLSLNAHHRTMCSEIALSGVPMGTQRSAVKLSNGNKRLKRSNCHHRKSTV